MAESSIFWQTNATGDGVATGYTQAQMFEFLRSLLVPVANLGGVAPDYQNKLAVSGTATPVSVATGAALVYGIPYVNTGAVTVAIPTPSGATRIDRIVLRANWTAQTVRITRIAGSEGGAAPALTQNAGTTWDIPLAQVSITTAGAITVTDEREWLSLVGVGAVTAAKLATDAVETAKIKAGAVTWAKLADGIVTREKIATNAVGADQIDAGAVAASELATGAVIEAKIGAGAVTEGKIGTGAVTETKLGTGAVTASKLGSGAVGAAAMAANAVATASLQDDAVTQAKIGAGAVGTTELADNSVDDTKAGNRVPQFYRRKGSHGTSWYMAGDVIYTPGAVRMQAGAAFVAFLNTHSSEEVTLNFPEAFGGAPLVFATVYSDNTTYEYVVSVKTVNAAQAVFLIQTAGDEALATTQYPYINWLAIGPE